MLIHSINFLESDKVRRVPKLRTTRVCGDFPWPLTRLFVTRNSAQKTLASFILHFESLCDNACQDVKGLCPEPANFWSSLSWRSTQDDLILHVSWRANIFQPQFYLYRGNLSSFLREDQIRIDCLRLLFFLKY